jgi:DNA-binding transcriptional MerR regulator
MTPLTVGALAKRTGLTVRTLHHYDEIGLLSPSHRNEAGYRLYVDTDVQRLERIVLLRSLGVPLDRIASALDSDANTLLDLLQRQMASVDAQLDETARLRTRLAESIEQLTNHGYRTLDDALDLVAAVKMFERYFNEEQRAALRARAQQLGPERIREAEAQWIRLIADVRREMDAGTSPDNVKVLALAEEWQELLDEFVNGRGDVAASAGRMMNAEPTARNRMAAIGLNAEVMDYVSTAIGNL